MATSTSFSGSTYWLCPCCAAHQGGDRLVARPAKCPECGHACSCEGCVVESLDRALPAPQGEEE